MIHAVWGTKNREPFLISEIRALVIEHIKENAREKRIYVDTINGYTEHMHCLFGLNADMALSKAMQLIKGESAYWINKNSLTKNKFEWADEYYAVSISDSVLDKVRAYILNQEEHHKKITFAQEYQEFMDKYSL
jgi:REP element-mobilizing transposase RayT